MPNPPHDSRKRPGLLASILAAFLILGEKLGPLRRPLLWGLVLLGGLLALGFVPRALRSRRLASEARAEANQLPTVSVTRAERAPGLLALTLPGNVEAIETTQLSARTSGYVRRYYVDIGDRVREGQVLADIETPDVDVQAQGARADLARSQAALAQSGAQVAQQSAALQTSRAGVARAIADLARARQAAEQQRGQLRAARANAELARVTWERWQSLVAGGAISQQEADEKHAAYNSSLANVSSLEAALRASNADVASYVAALNASRAEVAAANQNVNAFRAAQARRARECNPPRPTSRALAFSPVFAMCGRPMMASSPRATWTKAPSSVRVASCRRRVPRVAPTPAPRRVERVNGRNGQQWRVVHHRAARCVARLCGRAAKLRRRGSSRRSGSCERA